MSYDILKEIEELKIQKDALILAHYSEEGEIQDIADVVGDSFTLAKYGRESNKPVVLLAGVVFMAESVKLLSPDKTVLVPDLEASCSLVKEAPFDAYLHWRRQHPEAIAVTYINSSTEVKSISDVIVTSSNAAKIIESIPRDRPILFGPDKNLGAYLAKQTGREMILWPGTCQVHVLFSARKLDELKQQHPQALVLAHPECDETVLAYADVIGSTSRLLEEVKSNPSTEFIVATETGILHQMQKYRPEAKLVQAPFEASCACNNCPYMKLNSLEKIRHSLQTLTPQIEVAPHLFEPAQLSLDRMMKISQGNPVQWPERFGH